MPRRNFKHKPPKFTPFRLAGSETCQTKQAYATEYQAKQAVARAKQYNPELELKVYFCLNCQKYHLTHSKPGNYSDLG